MSWSVPSPFAFVILTLAAYRLTRLAGWDDFPLAAKIRAWVIGERWVAAPVEFDTEELVPIATEPLIGRSFPTLGDAARAIAEAQDNAPSLPGKQPSSEADGVRPAYDRPKLAHLVHCPYCIGFWISLATWLSWTLWHPTIYGFMPFAISGAVGLIAKNWDA